jgi:uncharacterized protein (TIGR03083 family)
MPENDQQYIVEALREVWTGLHDFCSEFPDDHWIRPVPLPGWDVRSTFTHVFGTEAMLLGRRPTAEVKVAELAHVKNPIGELNEQWVATYAGLSTDELLDEFQSLTTERLAVLEAMPPEQWSQVGPTPAGQASYGRFMQIRVFDCWMHEQDIRAGLELPGHESGVAVDVSLDEMTQAMGFVVGKRAGAPKGSSVTFDLTGPGWRQINVEVGERAAVVDELAEPATVTLKMPVIWFTRIAGGRQDAAEHLDRVEVSGDEQLGNKILTNLAYTI